MRSLGRRLEALEHGAREAFMEQASPLQVAWVNGLKRATPEEISELGNLWVEVAVDGLWPTPEESPRLWKLREAVLYRASPFWAEETRIMRDILIRELDRLREEWEEAGRHRCSTWQSDPEYWTVAQAAANRSNAIRRGAEAITDDEEVERILAAIRAPASSHEEILRLVGW